MIKQYSDVKEFDVDDETGKINKVTLKDEDKTEFTFSQFVALFKKRLQTIIAGEVISFDDYWAYDKHISSEGMEKHLEVVEAEGLISSLKVPKLTKGQLISIGAIVVLVFVALIAAMFLKSMGMLGIILMPAMTVAEYKRWQAGKKPNLFGKLGLHVKFWKTNPTYKQEHIRSEITMFTFYLGAILGAITGLSIGFMIGVST